MVDLSQRMLDLLRIASSVYFVDKVVRRRRGKGPAEWPRSISCSIELQDWEFWSEVAHRELLEETIGFVSGDVWRFEFVAGGDNTGCDQESFFPQMVDLSRPSVACLYSGGLDSAAGLAYRLSEGVGSHVLAVVVRHRSDIGALARKQLKALARKFDCKILPVVVPVNVVSADEIGATEPSQRARSFLFVSVGGVVAWATGSRRLELYESGVGAVNFPLLAGMEGSQATRSCHPHFLDLMTKLLTLAAEKPVEVVLPFKMLTKGEVTKALAGESLQELAVSTASCVSYPIREKEAKSCGVCPACLFRRVALHAAGIEETSGTYQCDLLKQHVWPTPEPEMKYLKAFLLMVEQLSEVDEGRLPPLLSRHLADTKILANGQSERPYVELYGRYRQEWFSLLRQAKANGAKWVNLIDLPVEAA